MLTTAEAADRLGITARSVARIINNGRMKAQRRGRDWFIKESEVKRYQETRKVGRPKKERPQ